MIAPPGGNPVTAMWDVAAFYIRDPDQWNAIKSHPTFNSAWALDWSAANPKFLAGVFQSHLEFLPNASASGYSEDGGQTWTKFPSLENETHPKELKYGVIAVSSDSTDKIVWSPHEGKLPYYTLDRGKTWQQSKFNGATATALLSHPMPQKPLCADRVLANTFYFYIPEIGIFRSEDNGANFNKVGNPLESGGRWNCFLKSTPGHAGHLWFAEGQGGGLRRSVDGGKTWIVIHGVKEAFCMGLGKAATEGGYHTLFIAGVINNEYGIYRSTDEGQTWLKIGDYPMGITDWVDAMDGDKNVFGKVYIGFAGAGFAYGQEAKPAK